MNTTPSEKPKRQRKVKEPARSRFKKDGFEIFKNGLFNLEAAPWGFNWFLGYCEQTSNQ